MVSSQPKVEDAIYVPSTSNDYGANMPVQLGSMSLCGLMINSNLIQTLKNQDLLSWVKKCGPLYTPILLVPYSSHAKEFHSFRQYRLWVVLQDFSISKDTMLSTMPINTLASISLAI